MKRKTLTIVSIVSIIIISLLLLGITYGYFLTNITGNENSKSVEVVTGDSKVLFTDLSTTDISETIEPGYKTVKTFTVQNTGDVSATYSIYLVDVINNFNRTQDITYNLYKKQGTITDVTITTDLSEANGWSRVNEDANVIFPTTMSVIAANEKIQNPNEIYTYVLKVEYIDHPTENQNEDQGKTFAFKVNLRAEDSITNPFSEGTLAYNIIDNANSETNVDYNKTVYIEPTLQDGINYTIPAQDKSGETERILTYTTDNYGTSYYYRGNIEDNYVTFSNKCWRIVRIQGDGSIKLTLESQSPCSQNITSNFSIGTTNWGFIIENDNYIGDYKNSTTGMKNALTTWLNATDNGERTNITTNAENLLKTEEWCLGNVSNTYAFNSPYEELGTTAAQNYESGTAFFYETGKNLYGYGVTPNATFVCDGETDESKIGALTADEVIFAGGLAGTGNDNYYLQNDSYLWWTLSRYGFYESYAHAFYMFSNGGVFASNEVSNPDLDVRPSVSLNANVKISDGVGTKIDPYIIDEG